MKTTDEKTSILHKRSVDARKKKVPVCIKKKREEEGNADAK